MRFAGKGAFVTGAGHGIGRATTVRLADEGAAVLCFDLKPEGAEETALLIEGRGGRGAAARGYVRDRGSIESALAFARERSSSVSYLVNNAGLITMTGLMDLTEEQWDLLLDDRLRAPPALFLNRGALPGHRALPDPEGTRRAHQDRPPGRPSLHLRPYYWARCGRGGNHSERDRAPADRLGPHGSHAVRLRRHSRSRGPIVRRTLAPSLARFTHSLTVSFAVSLRSHAPDAVPYAVGGTEARSDGVGDPFG